MSGFRTPQLASLLFLVPLLLGSGCTGDSGGACGTRIQACGDQVEARISGSGKWDTYPGSAWSSPGGEHLVELRLEAPASLLVEELDSNLEVDYFLLAGCGDNQDVVAMGDAGFSLSFLSPGTYYIVVDARQGGAEGVAHYRISCLSDGLDVVAPPEDLVSEDPDTADAGQDLGDPDQRREEEVCCLDAAGGFSVMELPECLLQEGARTGPAEQCARVCCDLAGPQGSGPTWAPAFACQAAGKEELAEKDCLICCLDGDLGDPYLFEDKAICEGDDGLVSEDRGLCEMTCCFAESYTPEIPDWRVVSEGLCQGLSGTSYAEEACDPVCCRIPGDEAEGFFPSYRAQCGLKGGDPEAWDPACEQVCCLLPGGEQVFSSTEACSQKGGSTLELNDCQVSSSLVGPLGPFCPRQFSFAVDGWTALVAIPDGPDFYGSHTLYAVNLETGDYSSIYQSEGLLETRFNAADGSFIFFEQQPGFGQWRRIIRFHTPTGYPEEGGIELLFERAETDSGNGEWFRSDASASTGFSYDGSFCFMETGVTHTLLPEGEKTETVYKLWLVPGSGEPASVIAQSQAVTTINRGIMEEVTQDLMGSELVCVSEGDQVIWNGPEVEGVRGLFRNGERIGDYPGLLFLYGGEMYSVPSINSGYSMKKWVSGSLEAALDDELHHKIAWIYHMGDEGLGSPWVNGKRRGDQTLRRGSEADSAAFAQWRDLAEDQQISLRPGFQADGKTWFPVFYTDYPYSHGNIDFTEVGSTVVYIVQSGQDCSLAAARLRPGLGL